MKTIVRDVMTRSVVTARPETPLKEVARLLVEHAISGLPVVGPDGRVLGVVSEADFLIKERGAAAVRRRPLASLFGDSTQTRRQLAKVAASSAGEAMTGPAITIEVDQTPDEAAAIMVRQRVNRLPVTEDGRLVGIVTRADLIRGYVRSDAELAESIREDVLRRALWLDPAHFEVGVEDGVARLAGHVERRSTAEIVERVVALVPGVIGVRAEIDWSIDDRDVQAPGRDYVSRYEAPRGR
ncbi:MAG TPA: CBS domain-containing protein [Candidatus Limnocylindrales bacterium]|nr:CBS domain-containing protein [Candidatus Limnocylindrales bacterium]